MKDSDRIKCEKCGGATSANFADLKFTVERRFSGRGAISRRYAVHPMEVAEAKAKFDKTGARIHDNGDIEFSSRGVEQKFAREWERLDAEAYGKPERRPTGQSQARLREIREKRAAKAAMRKRGVKP